MLAAPWHGRRDVRVEEIGAPDPGPGEVVLAVGWCGIRATDVEEYREGPVILPVDHPNGLTGRRAPLTLGHGEPLLIDPLHPVAGRLEVPQGPGLGIRFDEERLRAHIDPADALPIGAP